MKRNPGRWIVLLLVIGAVGFFAWRILTREDPNPRQVVVPPRPGAATGIEAEPPVAPPVPAVPRDLIGDGEHPGSRLRIRLFWQPSGDSAPGPPLVRGGERPSQGRLVAAITALEGNALHVPPGAHVPYLDVSYDVVLDSETAERPLTPFIAADGLFYAGLLEEQPAAGEYEVRVRFEPPSAEQVAVDVGIARPAWRGGELAFTWHIEQEDANRPREHDDP